MQNFMSGSLRSPQKIQEENKVIKEEIEGFNVSEQEHVFLMEEIRQKYFDKDEQVARTLMKKIAEKFPGHEFSKSDIDLAEYEAYKLKGLDSSNNDEYFEQVLQILNEADELVDLTLRILEKKMLSRLKG